MTAVILHEQREKSLLRRHPWIFSRAVIRVQGDPKPGDTVDIRGSKEEFLGRGAYSPVSQIRVRVWTFDEGEEVGEAFFRRRISRAIALRSLGKIQEKTSAFRLVNAESDGLPGLIVDRYSGFLVCQFLSAGAEQWKETIAAVLNSLVPNQGIFERSDADVREKEGLAPSKGLLSGMEPPEFIEIQENGCRFLADIRNGHKTGFYLDQRDNRTLAAGYARDAEVLNCFAYTGGFAVHVLRHGAARVTNVEVSAEILDLARRNIDLNGCRSEKVEWVQGDVFKILRQCRDAGRQFDMIILDPPKFAESKAQIDRAARGYKDINLLAFKLLRPGGVLFTFSCSGVINRDLFQKIIADAALDAGRDARILHHLSQASDHPVALNFPEGAYLKGAACRVW
jgi:23S rRNA (cytosine1962-C5)-methyltransferase